MQHKTLLPAFAAPGDDAQHVFRLALTALSEPGSVHDVGDLPGLASLAPATYALCLTLFDSDTPIWLAPSLNTAQIRENLAFHCACPVTRERKQAAFALVTESDLADLSAFQQGTDRDPHLSCTVIVQLDSLESGRSTTWQGPGIADRHHARLPVPASFWTLRTLTGFPRGLDFFFTAGRQLTGLPRSTRVLRTVQEIN
ncbi:MAG: phosphonate C-P lyase system protein PhnH [Candidimonas sp.]|nr:phosphonate C-P lyase system protein PhnH [Candidimonas sp.]